MFKKINTYLIENYPLIWHSKLPFLISCSIFVWLLSFVAGFLIIDLPSLSESYSSNQYFDSNFMSFHAVVSIIIFVFWMISFFKNNPLKSFYPLQRLYYIKLFLILILPFGLILSAYIPFTKGVQLKTKQLIDETVFKQEIKALNLASAFIPINSDQYNIRNRSYPKPFPLESFKYDYNNNSWDYTRAHRIDKGGTNDPAVYYDIDSTNTLNVDGLPYQFFTSKTISDETNCSHETFITQFYTDEIRDLELHKKSILNYSRLLIYNSIDYVEFDPDGVDYDAYENPSKHDFSRDFAPRIHNWVKTNAFDSIQQSVSVFISILNKYAIQNNLDERLLINYFKIKGFHAMSQIGHDNVYVDVDAPTIKELSYQSGEDLISSLEFYKPFFYDSYAIDYLYQNNTFKDKSLVDFDFLLAYFVAVVILVWILLLFEIAKPLYVIIALPTAGVLSIIGVIVILFSFARNQTNSFWLPFFVFLLIIAIIQVVSQFALHGKWMKQSILEVLMVLAYLSLPLILPIALGFVNELTVYHEKASICNDYIERKYIFNGILISPYIIISAGFIGVITSLLLARNWKSKPE